MNPFEDSDCDRLNLRAKSPHSGGWRATPGRGAMAIGSFLDMGEGGVMAVEVDELESKLPADEHDAPLGESGLTDELESRFWQL